MIKKILIAKKKKKKKKKIKKEKFYGNTSSVDWIPNTY